MYSPQKIVVVFCCFGGVFFVVVFWGWGGGGAKKFISEIRSECQTVWIQIRQDILYNKIVNIFLPITLRVYFGCSKEPSHLDGSFEYPHNYVLVEK